MNGKTRDTITLAQVERGWARCSRCGATVNQRVHRPKTESDAWEATLGAHFEGISNYKPKG